jgi:hypothetical protein
LAHQHASASLAGGPGICKNTAGNSVNNLLLRKLWADPSWSAP